MTTMTTIGSIGCAIETHKEENEVLLDGNSALSISQNFRCIFDDSYDDVIYKPLVEVNRKVSSSAEFKHDFQN
jgi:hypothetical protein